MADTRWCCERSLRIDVEIDPEGRSMRDRPVCLRVNFEEMLKDSGTDGVFDRDSVAVVRVDSSTGEPIACSEAYADARKYQVPHRLFWDQQNQDLEDKIAWLGEDSSDIANYSIYFDVIGESYPAIDFATTAIGAGEPLVCSNVDLNTGFWSTPTAVSWGKDGTKDLIVGTLSERNVLRYFENIGTTDDPLFKEGVRLKSGGALVRGTQSCAIDWNGDGVEDLLVLTSPSGLREERVIDLYEKAGEGGFPELEKRGSIVLEGSEYGAISGFAAADWDSDGLWDIIVSRTDTDREARFLFHRNIGDSRNPSFAEGKVIRIDGEEKIPV